MSRRGEIFHAKALQHQIGHSPTSGYCQKIILISQCPLLLPRLWASEPRLCNRHPSVHSQDGFLARMSTAKEASVEEFVYQVREFRLRGKFHREIYLLVLYNVPSSISHNLQPSAEKKSTNHRPGFPVPAGYLITRASSQNVEESTFPRTEQHIR